MGLALVGWGIFSAREILYPERSTAPPPHPLPTYTTHLLQTPGAYPLNVWRLEVPAPRARLLIFHGYHANRYQVLGIAAALRERGYESLLFELRGHGDRPGPCTFGLKEADDADAVLQWLRDTTPGEWVPMGVLGLSMGAALACQVAWRHAEVQAVVADSVYSRFYPIVRFSIQRRYRLPAWPWAWVTWCGVRIALRRRTRWLNPLALAPQLRQPLLAIQGGHDDVVPSSESDAFYQRWGGPKERWFEPAAAHVEAFTLNPQTYTNRVAEFFDRTLRS